VEVLLEAGSLPCDLPPAIEREHWPVHVTASSGLRMPSFVFSGLLWLLSCGVAGASPSTFDCIDAGRRRQLTAEINSDLERTGVPYRVIELRRAQIDFQRSECRFSALYSTGETRTLLLRILGDVDGVADYELELDEPLTAVG